MRVTRGYQQMAGPPRDLGADMVPGPFVHVFEHHDPVDRGEIDSGLTNRLSGGIFDLRLLGGRAHLLCSFHAAGGPKIRQY